MHRYIVLWQHRHGTDIVKLQSDAEITSEEEMWAAISIVGCDIEPESESIEWSDDSAVEWVTVTAAHIAEELEDE